MWKHESQSRGSASNSASGLFTICSVYIWQKFKALDFLGAMHALITLDSSRRLCYKHHSTVID